VTKLPTSNSQLPRSVESDLGVGSWALEVGIREAYASCEREARAHYENFPVASLLLPWRMRPHVAAVYAFARAADDFADEGQRSDAERLELLDGWERRLHQAVQSSQPGPAPWRGEPSNTPDVFLAVGDTIRSLSLPIALFEDLLSAFRQDVTVTRYRTWDDVTDYCRRSANPIGRLVLRIAGHDNVRLDGWSDAICTALQLTNFWQDLTVDFHRGRVYLPAEERERHGAREEDLAAGRITPEWQRALGDAAARTRLLFEEGRPVCDAVHGRLRYELRATWLGGVRVLARLSRARFDVVNHRPSLGARDVLWIAPRVLAWSR
jgi:squalene synthase HpnC